MNFPSCLLALLDASSPKGTFYTKSSQNIAEFYTALSIESMKMWPKTPAKVCHYCETLGWIFPKRAYKFWHGRSVFEPTNRNNNDYKITQWYPLLGIQGERGTLYLNLRNRMSEVLDNEKRHSTLVRNSFNEPSWHFNC